MNQGGAYNYTIAAADPENDAITYTAFFLQPWMSFGQTLRRLTVAPGGTPGKTYNVVIHVTTPSGGTDVVIARFTVNCSAPTAARPAHPDEASDGQPENPVRGAFSIATAKVPGATARLTIFDAAGRRVGDVRGPAGTRLVWEARDRDGHRASPGLYFYRLQIDRLVQQSRFVLLD